MAKRALIPVAGEVVEHVQGNLFKVILPNGHELLGHFSAKMQFEDTRILPGSKVKLQLTPHDLSRGRILQVLE